MHQTRSTSYPTDSQITGAVPVAKTALRSPLKVTRHQELSNGDGGGLGEGAPVALICLGISGLVSETVNVCAAVSKILSCYLDR